MERDNIGIDLSETHKDWFLNGLHFLIKTALRVLAILMVVLILFAAFDVCASVYNKLLNEPKFFLNVNEMFSTFGGFLTVLIAIEIFVNIVLYLKDNVVHVRLVVATALMAVSRKIIVFDYENINPLFVLGAAATAFSLGLTYWLVSQDKAPLFSKRK